MKFLVEVEAVRGKCTRGYGAGDRFIFNGLDTPDAFCGGAYTVLYPILLTLKSGGSFSWEKDPRCRTALGCPEAGTVLFRVSPVEE